MDSITTRHTLHIVGIVKQLLGLVTVVFALVMLWGVASGYRPLVVYSGSMNPTIPTGSVVFIKPTLAENLNVGDVVSIRPGAGQHLVTHRVQAKQRLDDQWLFQTKGDGNKFPDPKPFIVESTAGKVTFHLPWLGYAIVYMSNPLIRSGGVAIFVYILFAVLRSKPEAESVTPDATK